MTTSLDELRDALHRGTRPPSLPIAIDDVVEILAPGHSPVRGRVIDVLAGRPDIRLKVELDSLGWREVPLTSLRIRGPLDTLDDTCFCAELLARSRRRRQRQPGFTLSRLELELLMAYSVSGVIACEGLADLLEARYPEDPDFQISMAALRAIGCAPAADALARFLARYPQPEDLPEDPEADAFLLSLQQTLWRQLQGIDHKLAQHLRPRLRELGL